MTKHTTRRQFTLALAAAPLAGSILGGCGGEEEESGGGGGGGGGGNAAPVSIMLTVGDALGYDQNQLAAGAGAQVTVTVNHTGSMDANAMGHNFVLLAQGVDMAAFATAAMSATETNYVPADRASDVIAHTQIVGGGEQDSVTFTAPAAGTYKYLCTFPGHYSAMNGDFVVS
ncbi:MAG: plastocyanin/azurin family copper-binding protein [Myxococcota bacterium]